MNSCQNVNMLQTVTHRNGYVSQAAREQPIAIAPTDAKQYGLVFVSVDGFRLGRPLADMFRMIVMLLPMQQQQHQQRYIMFNAYGAFFIEMSSMQAPE